MNKASILIVEDEAGIARLVQTLLTRAGFTARSAPTLARAREELKTEAVDVALLDIMLPDGDGRDLIAEIRAAGDTAILMLSSKREYQDIFGSLTEGADDYLAKPFRNDELMARIDALLIKRTRRAEQKIIQRGLLSLDIEAMRALISGEDLALTPKDYALLLLFIQNEGVSILPEILYERLWKQPMASDSQAVRSAVSRLRGKLTGCGYTIGFIPSKGYSFSKESIKEFSET